MIYTRPISILTGVGIALSLSAAPVPVKADKFPTKPAHG